MGYFVCTVVGLCLPGVDFVSTFFEVAPLLVLFEGSIWLAVLLERRSTRLKARPRGVRQAISADWVLPVDGPPLERRFVAWEDGTDRRGRLRAARSATTRGAVILPGIVNAHSHLEYAVYAGFGDGQPFGDWLATHVARKRSLSAPTRRWRSPGRGVADSLAAGITTTADYSFSGAAATAATELGLRAIVYLEVFGSDPAAAERDSRRFARRLEESELVRIGISPHAPYTCSARGVPLGASRSGSRSARTSPRARARTSGSSTARVRSRPPRECSSSRPGSARSRRSPRCSAPSSSAPTASRSTRPRSRCSRGADVPVAHCPRSNAFLGCGTAPLVALRAAGVRVGLGTDSPASTPSLDPWDGAARRRRGRARPRAAPGRARGRGRASPRYSGGGARARARQRDSGASRRASEPT